MQRKLKNQIVVLFLLFTVTPQLGNTYPTHESELPPCEEVLSQGLSNVQEPHTGIQSPIRCSLPKDLILEIMRFQDFNDFLTLSRTDEKLFHSSKSHSQYKIKCLNWIAHHWEPSLKKILFKKDCLNLIKKIQLLDDPIPNSSLTWREVYFLLLKLQDPLRKFTKANQSPLYIFHVLNSSNCIHSLGFSIATCAVGIAWAHQTMTPILTHGIQTSLNSLSQGIQYSLALNFPPLSAQQIQQITFCTIALGFHTPLVNTAVGAFYPLTIFYYLVLGWEKYDSRLINECRNEMAEIITQYFQEKLALAEEGKDNQIQSNTLFDPLPKLKGLSEAEELFH